MEYKRIFKSEDGAVLEMKIKADCSTKEEIHKIVSFIDQSARIFYLQTAEKISRNSLESLKRDYLSLAKKFHVPISSAIEHYDTLSKKDT